MLNARIGRTGGAILILRIIFIAVSLWPSVALSLTVFETSEVPAGTILEVRLTRSVASFSTKRGSDVEGVLVAPIRQGQRILIPIGTKVTGNVQQVRRVGLGFVHETARIEIVFKKLILPGGIEIPLSERLTEVDNARESVDREGRVEGIRSTGTYGFRAGNLIAGFAMVDPIAYLYMNVATPRMLRFAEPEIWLPAGTELIIKLLSPLTLPQTYASSVAPIEAGPADQTTLKSLLRKLPYRTMTADSNKPSDLTNLVFLGSPAALQRAFRAAGWVQSHELSMTTGFMTLRSIAENQGYQSAPMSTLLLDEQKPDFTLSKTLNTFAKRHHLRIWQRPETWEGATVLTASSTQDIGIAISRKNKTFIHVIDTFIDNERAKIVNDLVFTGCVGAGALFPRPWVPMDAKNGTGEPLITDGNVAVLQLNECKDPKHAIDLEAAPDIPARAPVVERGFRQSILTFRNDIYRGNLVYQGYEGINFARRHFKQKEQTEELPPRTTELIREPGAPEVNADEEPATKEHTLILRELAEPAASAIQSPSEKPPRPRREETERSVGRFEIGAQGGWLRYGSNTLDFVRLSLEPRFPIYPPAVISFQNRLYSGWAAGTSLTLNSWKYFSNEFAFTYQRGGYRLGASIFAIPGIANTYQEETTGLLTRQFQYNFVASFRRREARFRPYLAAGPVFEMLNITDAPFKSSGGVFRVGLRNAGLILAAYNFASRPPLNGGGIFQFGFQYGGGLKVRVSRRWLMRLDVRETLSPQPKFIEKSLRIDDPSDSDEYLIHSEFIRPNGSLRQQRATLGISLSF